MPVEANLICGARSSVLSYIKYEFEANMPYVLNVNYHDDYSQYCPFVDDSVQPPVITQPTFTVANPITFLVNAPGVEPDSRGVALTQ